MNHKHLLSCIACGAVLLAFVTVGNARAENNPLDAVQFPISELGGCESKDACKAYCDDETNIQACISFAEKNGLMPKEEIEVARKFMAAGARGPGGCRGKESCEAYCNDTEHIDACVAFAEENGLMSGSELAEAKKVQAAIRSGIKPPPCGGRQACDAYCENPDNMPACIEFAKAAGLMSEEEQANAEKMLQAIRSGAKPPACRGKEECDAYCAIDANFDECLAFAKAAGYMTDEEYDMAKKTRGKGPGGCRGKEACDAFCSSSQENEELCMNFARENGLLSEERQREMEADGQRFRQSFANMPPQVESCLIAAWGAETYEKLKAGTIQPSRWLGDAMSACFGRFEQERMQNEQPGGPQNPMQQYSGPQPGGAPECGGENCRPPEGFMPPQGAFTCEGNNCRPPEGFVMPDGQFAVPPAGQYPSCEGENCRPLQPAPAEDTTGATEPAHDTSEPTAPAITPESFSGAVILFLQSLGS